MDDSFWKDVQAAFAELASLPPEIRVNRLDTFAGSDRVRAEVASLLEAHDRADRLPRRNPGPPAPASPLWSAVGQTVGDFRLVEHIGQGGMGAVYRGERADREFHQRVAVKIIDLPMRSGDALRRFRSERHILAALSHPHIVTLLDGGVTGPGQAYLAMEFVEGVPITQFCAAHRASLADRVGLLRQVCSAVQHAHQRGVVHRDLKPDNILVTPDGQAKVLDFGIAKLLDPDPDSGDTTVAGAVGALTPNYASPEQLRGLPVTTASDLYALGVLLYEILAGARPYETAGRSFDDVLRIVVAGHVARPSAVAAVDASRPYPPNRLRGDLDSIVAKAMHVDADRRYASAEELAADLLRFQSGEPVVARPPSWGYLAANLARRHRSAVIASGVAAAALIAALGVSIVETRVAVKERARAEQRFRDLRQLANALIFKIHDGVQPLPGSTEVRKTIVAEALTYLEKISADLGADPDLTLELARGYHRIGLVQGKPSSPNLGDSAGAIKSLRRAVALLEAVARTPAAPEAAARELVAAHVSLAEVLRFSGARQEARVTIDSAVARSEQLAAGREDDEMVQRLLASAYFQQALTVEFAASLPIWQKAAAIFSALLAKAPEDADRQRNVALAQKYIGAVYAGERNSEAARAHYMLALQVDEKRLASRPGDRSARFDVAIDLANLGNEYQKDNLQADAREYYQRSVDLRRSLADQDPQDILARSRLAYGYTELARTLVRLARYQEAMRNAREAVRIDETLVAVDDFHRVELAAARSVLAWAQAESGDRATGCAGLLQVRSIAAALRAEGVAPAPQFRLDQVEKGLPAMLAKCRVR